MSRTCKPLRSVATSYARAQIMQAEGVDRPLPALTQRGIRLGAASLPQIFSSRHLCRPRPTAGSPQKQELIQPRSGELFFGTVKALVANGAKAARIYINAVPSGRNRAIDGVVKFTVAGDPGSYNLKVCSRGSSGRKTCSASRDVWFLPPVERKAVRERTRNFQLESRLRGLGRHFRGYSAFWVHDLRTGKTAGWNSDARFPAASTVKLGLLAAALRHWGPRPERSQVAYDLKALTGWSSNLATNRLLLKLGGSETAGAEIAQAFLYRLGARESTFTGGYRVGTGRGGHAAREDVIHRPPLVSARVTTAHDLGRMLYTLHSAAKGNPATMRKSGLARHEASVGMAMLLSSQPRGDNIGLFRPSVGRRLPMAQKNGWLSDARHTAAILYTRRGPEIAVLMTYRYSLSLRAAISLGRRFVALLGLRR